VPRVDTAASIRSITAALNPPREAKCS
jgi:hypothetical protein